MTHVSDASPQSVDQWLTMRSLDKSSLQSLFFKTSYDKTSHFTRKIVSSMLSHLLRQALTVLAVMGLATASASANFERPLTSRIFQSGKYALMNTNGQVSITPAQAASAMAKIQPSYISGLIRLSPNENLTQDMVRSTLTISTWGMTNPVVRSAITPRYAPASLPNRPTLNSMSSSTLTPTRKGLLYPTKTGILPSTI